MRLQVYQGNQLAAIFEYGHEPTYHGSLGQQVKALIETGRDDTARASVTMPGVPDDWLTWIASVVQPVLAAGGFVRWYGYS
jgi:hypothetical protein